MDFVKKFASEQLEKQLSGNNNENQQQHQQQNQGYGNQQSSNYGGFNEQQQGGGGGYGQGQQQQQQGSQFGVTGGPEYNAPHGQGGASSFLGGGGGGSSGGPQINQAEAMQAANQHAGNGNENASLFSQAFSFVSNMNKDDGDIDEDKVQQEHKEAYDKGNAGNMSASAMGSAAALQAIKQFTQGSSNASAPQQEKGGNDMVSKIIGMAISEAAKMFDKSGGAASGDKQDAVNSASQTVMKLLIKNQVSGMIGGGQSSGGLGQLMGMASKFM